tara:strand:- start:908 stop:1078 length:171 start_codon:yes stop_codon:yes gene_type:complete
VGTLPGVLVKLTMVPVPLAEQNVVAPEAYTTETSGTAYTLWRWRKREGGRRRRSVV